MDGGRWTVDGGIEDEERVNGGIRSLRCLRD